MRHVYCLSIALQSPTINNRQQLVNNAYYQYNTRHAFAKNGHLWKLMYSYFMYHDFILNEK